MSTPSAIRPRRSRSTIFSLLSAMILVAAMISCTLPTMPMKPSASAKHGGTLDLTISGNTAKTLLPGIDMNIASYQIKGTGPNGVGFDQTTTQTSNVFTGLVVGSWDIVVAALNASGQNIGIGSNSVTLSANDAVSLAITVAPIQGNGTLSLTTTWPASEVAAPSINASLLPPAGAAIPLTYTIGSGSATLTDSSIPSGYYTLTQTLLDNGVVVMGAVEVVRIVAGAVTSGTFDFSNLNMADPTITVNITPLMDNPLTVALSGVSTSLAYGGSMTATPSATGYSGNITYVYYLNGQAKGTATSASPSWTFGSDLAPGNYRLDVTAYSADGLQAGSTSANFTVVVPAGSVVLAWNPDSDPTVTGYKINYGTASGSYTASVDVSTKTMGEVSGLLLGETYYFAATGYTSAGVQSGYSNEVTFTVPAS